MNKNINAVVELTEKELACVTGGRRIVGGEGGRLEDRLSIFRKIILLGKRVMRMIFAPCSLAMERVSIISFVAPE